MRPAAVPIAALLALALAGCTGGGDGAPSAGTTTTAAALATSTGPAANLTEPLDALAYPLELSGCLQLHTFFPFPAAVFTQLGFTPPAGFTLASSNGQTVDVFLAWWSCEQGLLNDTRNAPFGAVGSMVAALPVVPPADLAGRDPVAAAPLLDLLPLTWIVSSQIAADYLDQVPGLAGGYVEVGPVAPTSALGFGAAGVSGMEAHASFGTFAVDVPYQAQPETNPADRYRMWLAVEGQPVPMYLEIANGEGPSLGGGGAVLRFQGDPGTGAPPATAGMGHVVSGVPARVRAVELP